MPNKNIVHNVQIFIKSIQADGPTCVLRRQALEHTPQVTNLNLNPFPFKIFDSMKTMWREKEECQSIQTEKVMKGLKLIKQMTRAETKNKT